MKKIYNNNIEIGKILIEDEYPFALVKYLDKNFNEDIVYKINDTTFKIIVPSWLKI